MPTPAAVRSQIAAHLGLLESAPGVLLLTRQSAEPPEFMRSPSHSPVHLEFGVGSPGDAYAARNKSVRTDIVVLIPYQLETLDRIDGATGYTAMLTLHAAIAAALTASHWTAELPKNHAPIDIKDAREPGPDGWIWLTTTFTALHSLA